MEEKIINHKEEREVTNSWTNLKFIKIFYELQGFFDLVTHAINTFMCQHELSSTVYNY